ncbi:MAG: NAD(P)(+) transhydrogenase (Re/Si-specific) subunit beta [Rhodopirellula sp.]|nr:NAD(P)(+) transhydrogenase (Re/Si-specific) subunit beta [Rhodopirellula sp.]
MDQASRLFVDLAIVAAFLLGIGLFRGLQTARRGNFLAAMALASALGIVIARHSFDAWGVLLTALLAGSLIGWAVAMRVHMIQIPAMIALQNGAGGMAAFLVAFVELTRGAEPSLSIRESAGTLGLVVGALTAGGSLVAAGKLAGLARQTPVHLPGHAWLLRGGAAAALAVGILAALAGPVAAAWLLAVTILFSLALGIVFSIRVGGADMPVLISLLNSLSGLAAALCGVVVVNRLLIVCGATVAASGFILTAAMCRAMNRSLWSIGFRIPTAPVPVAAPPADPLVVAVPAPGTEPPQGESPLQRAVAAAREAETIIVIPGYGMALAHAQFETAQLAERLRSMGKQVRMAVHPIAGRMPGHMHVLLAEAEVDPDAIFDLDEINADFHETDLAVIVGACDVVNPAAIDVEGTPIAGMPILAAHDARRVLVCNLDDRPGYSGVDNPLYRDPKTILMLGDAKAGLRRLLEALGP